MIGKVISRGLAYASSRMLAPVRLLAVPHFSFAGKVQKTSTSFSSVIEKEIQAEEENTVDLSEHLKNFEEKGWSLSKQDTVAELSKTVGRYEVRLISNIKAPTNFGDQENKEQEEEKGENEYSGEMNEVTICVTRKGEQKTMVIHTIVTEGFEISALNFAPTYADAKKGRLDFYNSNTYTGPEVESLSEDLFDGIYNFLENEC